MTTCICEEIDSQTLTEKEYVLVLYTGGTIGMKEGPNGYAPAPTGYFEELVSSYPNFNDPDYKLTEEDKLAMKQVIKDDDTKKDLKPLPLHVTQDGWRIIYGILDFDPPLDSSNMKMSDWTKIAKSIYNNYKNFGGFVVLHGTDTMAYTSSALSFMLQNLGKAVVVTGSQVPLAKLRTDGIENFVGALMTAGRWGRTIKEVGLFFDSKLFRGNRTTKVNASGFGAFDSPNLPPLAKIGVQVDIHKKVLEDGPSYDGEQQFTLHPNMDPSVGVFMLFPGITGDQVRAFLKAVKGAVILTFGAGNGPDDVMQAFTDASKADPPVLMLNITQCLKGQVEAAYAVGTALKKAGLIPGGDMTPEAALTKLSYLLGRKDLTFEQKKDALHQNIRGEVTPHSIKEDY